MNKTVVAIFRRLIVWIAVKHPRLYFWFYNKHQALGLGMGAMGGVIGVALIYQKWEKGRNRSRGGRA